MPDAEISTDLCNKKPETFADLCNAQAAAIAAYESASLITMETLAAVRKTSDAVHDARQIPHPEEKRDAA